MHEDYEATGAYIYEDVRDFKKSVLAPEIKRALLEKHIALQEVNSAFALGPKNGSDRIVHRYEPGVVLADVAAEAIAFQSPGMMLTTKLLLSGHANSTLRIETGQTRESAMRVAAQKEIVLIALKAIREHPEHFETPQFTDANLGAIRAHFANRPRDLGPDSPIPSGFKRVRTRFSSSLSWVNAQISGFRVRPGARKPRLYANLRRCK